MIRDSQMTKPQRFQLLDYGRFIAVTSVMFFHYCFNGIQNGKISSIRHISGIVPFAKYGYLGVEFFFLISGYVIFITAKDKTATEFAVSRAVRLYPAFWFSVIFSSIIASLWGGQLMSVSVAQVLANMTMIPGWLGYDFVDGVYWTLQYELSFYLLVFLSLMIGLKQKLNTLFMVWPYLMLSALALEKQHLPYLGGYYYYFAAGGILAIQKERLSVAEIHGRLSLSLFLCILLCVSFSAGGALHLSKIKGIPYSSAVIAIIVLAQFLFFSFLNSGRGQRISLPGSKLAGGITYPIYLIHAHLGYILISQFATEENKVCTYFLTLSTVLAVALFCHLVIEKKLAFFWRRLFTQTIGGFIDKICEYKWRAHG